jgi:hypothetical protein
VFLVDEIPPEISISRIQSSIPITLSNGISYTWQLPDLEPGARGMITMTGSLSRSLPGGMVITNTMYIENAADINGGNNQAEMQLIVVNIPPVAEGDSFISMNGNILVVPAPGILSNDFDLNGDRLIATLVTQPPIGVLELHYDGSFTFSSPQNYCGVVALTYQAFDDWLYSEETLVTITITQAWHKFYLPVISK